MRMHNCKLPDLSRDYLIELQERIESRYIITRGGCWEWTTARFAYGYGKVSVKGNSRRAHRVYYQLLNGFIDDNLVISHLCDNPPCINPKHLEATVQQNNVFRGKSFAAENAKKTHCKNGHKYTKENTKIRTQNGHKRRNCRTCDLLQDRLRHRHYAEQRGKVGLTATGTLRVKRYKDRLPLVKI